MASAMQWELLRPVCILGGLSALVAIPAWVVAVRRGDFSKWEPALPFFVIFAWGVLVWALAANRKTLANMVEPVGLCLVAIFSIYAKTFLLARFVRSRRTATLAIYLFCLAAAVVLVLAVPPLPE